MATTQIKDIRDLDPVLKRMDKFSEKLRPEFFRAMTESVNEFVNQVQKRTPTGVGYGDHGHLGSSIYGDAYGTATGIHGEVGTPAVHGLPVEEGTKPHFPPETALWDWVRLKLRIKDQQEMISVAYLIALKISHHGTKGVHMFRDGFAASKPRMRRWFIDAFKKVGNIIG